MKDRKRGGVEISRFPVYEEYKPSCFEWAAHIPVTWQEKRAKFVFREIDERSSSGSEELLSVSHYTGITPRATKDVNMFLAESYEGSKLCEKDDLVINTMWAWMGALGVSDFDGIVSNAYGVYRLQKKSDYHPTYLNYLLRTKYYIGEYIKRSKGMHSSRWRLYPDSFLDIPILIPSLSEQTAIADFLDHKTTLINDFIARKERLIELLQEQKRVIINQAVTRGIDPDVCLKPSGVDWLGDIPEHWEVKKLKYLVKHITEQVTQKDPNDIYVSLEKIESGTGILDLSKGNGEFESQVKKFQKKDILFGRLRPYLAKVIIAPQKGVCVGELLVLRTTSLDYSHYLKNLLLSKDVINLINSSTFGAKMPRASWEFIGNIHVPFPADKIERRNICDFINLKTSHLDSAIAKANQEITLIKEYREALIAEAVTGKIDVRGWRKQREKSA